MIGPAHRLALLSLAVIGAAALFLSYRRDHQRLGAPGVTVAVDPLDGGDAIPARTNGIALPPRVLGFESADSPISEMEMEYLPADTAFGRRVYTDPIDGFQAQLSVVLMGVDRTSIHRPEQCLPWQGWSIVSKTEVPLTLRTADGERTVSVQRIDAATEQLVDGQPVPLRAVYVFWFVADGITASSHVSRHLQTLRGLVLDGELPRWAYVSYFTACRPGREDEAFRKLTRLMAETLPRFQKTGFASAGDP